MDENLKRLMVNLKNWSWSAIPKFTIDKNEGFGILKALQDIECKEKKEDKNNGNY